MAKKKTESKPTGHGIDAALDNITKLYGAGAVMTMGDSPTVGLEVIPTGSLKLDHALRVGGIPRGRIVEIYGPESSGKTTIALHIVAQAQRMIAEGKLEGRCAFIDAEQALDLRMAEGIGVDTDELIFSQPDYGEQGLEIAEEFIRSGGCPVVVIDSVAALVPKAELDGNMGDSLPGLQARLMSQALRKLTGYTRQSKSIVIFINQLRFKIGVMFGNPETTTGGNALKFYASVRIDVRIKQQLKSGDDHYGNALRMKVVKLKVAPPFREAETDLIFGRGFDEFGELVDLAVEHDIWDKKGAHYYWGEEKAGHGRDAARKMIEENENWQTKLRELIIESMKDS